MTVPRPRDDVGRRRKVIHDFQKASAATARRDDDGPRKLILDEQTGAVVFVTGKDDH